jgi:hypothetical protein
MSTKLVKLHLAEPLHRWVKTVATSRDEEIGNYITGVLEEHVPKEIRFDDANERNQKSSKAKKSPAKSNGL